MKVVLRNPRREIDVRGPISVIALLNRLEVNRESVLVIRGDTLVPGDAQLDDADTVEIRPVISGPMAEGNKHLAYKEALNTIEARSPGTKHDFYFGFLGRASDRFTPESDAVRHGLVPCDRCGSPTPGTDAAEVLCAFCKLVERAGGAEPVEVTTSRRDASGGRHASGGER